MTYAEHAAQIREAHTIDRHGWCRCGLRLKATPAEHAAHIASMTAEAAQRHAEKIAADTLNNSFAGRQALGGGSITLDGVREMLTAAALQALTEMENAR